MGRGLMVVVALVLMLAAYEAGQREAAVEPASTPEASRSVSRYVVTPVWRGGAEAGERAHTETPENSIRLLGPGISRDRQIRV